MTTHIVDVAVARSAQQLDMQFLVEKNADGIIVVDMSGVVLFANPAAEQIFNRPHHLLVGSEIGIPLVAGETTDIVIHPTGSDPVDVEIRVVDTIWEHRPARLATLRDVSARKIAEGRLRHWAKMEAIGELTAGIAHDFNNLLMVIIGNLEIAQRSTDLSTGSAARQKRAIGHALRGAHRAARLTQRLLAFSRRQPLDPKPVDINTFVGGEIEFLRRALGENIEIDVLLGPGDWKVEIDVSQLEAALLNIAVNARDAMPKGGKLTIETSSVFLDEDYCRYNPGVRPGPYVALSVGDNGIGMTSDVMSRAFEPFFTTKSAGQGTGLGLSQVYGFITQSGGQVKIDSEPGRGTTINIYLPLLLEESETQSETETRQPIGGQRGETILVVEDDADLRAYLIEALRDLNYRALRAQDAVSALGFIEQTEIPIHLLLTDLGLPGMSGIELAATARSLRPHLKVLFMTGYAPADREAHIRSEVLEKPITQEVLAARIRAALDGEH
jgi:signal transduction histidine kinase/CheY-like chemotaxis protein